MVFSLEFSHDSSDGRNPGQVGSDAGESSGIAELASGGGAEGDDTDLAEDSVGGDVAQWAAAVAVARSVSVGGGNADVVGGDNGSVNGRAAAVGHDGHVGLAKDWADGRGSCRFR